MGRALDHVEFTLHIVRIRTDIGQEGQYLEESGPKVI